jgi:hypothetical protein
MNRLQAELLPGGARPGRSNQASARPSPGSQLFVSISAPCGDPTAQGMPSKPVVDAARFKLAGPCPTLHTLRGAWHTPSLLPPQDIDTVDTIAQVAANGARASVFLLFNLALGEALCQLVLRETLSRVAVRAGCAHMLHHT